MSKQYGLIIPGKNEKKPNPIFQASRNVFGDNSDSDEEAGKKKPMLRPTTNVKKQVKLAQEKVLKEDPTVYQYDELYDDMEHKKKVEKTTSQEEKKPKYIEKLMQSASKRKREHERRLERQVQKEREKEGNEFADKESFVTSAYKQKLEELREEEEKEKREEYLEKIGDVTKQKDLGGFYRHIYEQKLGAEKKIKEEVKTSPEKVYQDDEKVDSKQSKHDKTPGSPHTKKNRNYRKRKSSVERESARELSEGEIVSDDEGTVPTLEDIRAIKKARSTVNPNIDADSDFSADSSDDEIETKKKKLTQENKETHSTKEGKDKVPKEDNEEKPKDEFKAPLEKSKEPIDKKSPPKPKVNIWEKRTVGAVFDEALKRYYERKAARSG